MNRPLAEPRNMILASGSPRRRQMLELVGMRFRVLPADVDESPLENEPALAYAQRVAQEKAGAVAGSGKVQGAPVLGADTVVEVEGEILGKPSGPAEAEVMLRRLSGVTHRVHTGVALALDESRASLVDTASVRFTWLSDEAIRWYVDTGEPLDKAGAYAIQGAGGLFIETLVGSPHTVIGLPLQRLDELFTRVGLSMWSFMSPGGQIDLGSPADARSALGQPA